MKGIFKTMSPDSLSQTPKVMRDFLGYLQTVKGKSAKTAQEYYLDLRTFFRYMKFARDMVDSATPFEEISIADIDIDFVRTVTLTEIFEYLNYVLIERKNSASTRARKVSSLKSFFKYLTNKAALLSIDPTKELDMPKQKSSLPKFLSLEQSIDLLNAVDGTFKERDYCMVTLFLNCGMRLSELVGINLNDIRSDCTLKLTGKGNKERIVYLNDACLAAIETYKKVRPSDIKHWDDKNALFISNHKKRISPKTVQFIINKYLHAIELGGLGYSVHKLRHTAATLMYQHGNVDIRILKDILGHANLGTTEIYTHLSDKQMHNAVKSNPLAQVSNISHISIHNHPPELS